MQPISNGFVQIPEDLHFVLRMRHMFESLGYQSGFFLSQLFSSSRTTSPSSTSLNPPLKQLPTRPPPPPPPIFNWSHPPPPQIPPPNFHHPPQLPKDNTHLFLLPHDHHHPHPHSQMEGINMPVPEHEPDLKWPNGLSFFTALTGRSDDAKLLFGHEGENKESDANVGGGSNTEDYLGLESHSNKVRKMENSGKFKRSFTMPARMATSSSSSSLNQHQQQQQHETAGAGAGQGTMEYRSSEAGIYSDIMETFLE